jgi:Xaa-Pro aminopeptidase
MAIAVEPIYRDPQLGGYHLEDLLLVTDDGAQLLSDATGTATPFVIRAH